ncbi:MAG TPA: hypothetical protein VE861_09030, partial [Gemmatimonadaceae bacterium]|nr:hypothetical protein [Gemmatimonadaceae bacterium]
MTWLFLVGAAGIALLEVALVYFIMPLPGSQRMRSIELAYALYSWRWVLRALFGASLLIGLVPVWRTARRARWAIGAALAGVGALVYVVNFRMAADQLFRQPR